jgi:hypothetical protein
MLKYHPDKAPEGKVEEYTERASRLNRAKEIILRAQGLSDDGDAAQADFFWCASTANLLDRTAVLAGCCKLMLTAPLCTLPCSLRKTSKISSFLVTFYA